MRTLLFALFLFLPVVATAQPTGESLLQRAQARFQEAQAIRIEFTQTIASDFGNETFRGTLLVQGTRMRVEAGPQTFVTDGVSTWLYSQTQNQVVINRFIPDQTGINPAALMTTYATRFRITETTRRTQDGTPATVVRLAPTSRNEFFETVTLTLRDRDAQLLAMEMRDLNGTTMRYQIRGLHFNPTVPARSFTFTPPRGAQVIDLRS